MSDTDDAGGPLDLDDVDGDEVELDEDDSDDGGNRALAPTAAEVVRYLVKALVDDPDAVHVDAIERRRGVLLEVRVAQGELGRVIGRKGRTAQSLRTVARAAATRDGVSLDVDFVD
jgi:predicted RNA-binding protein YlqC (UPF0109 family)